MSRLVLITISILILCFVTPHLYAFGIQQKRVVYGPVVKAYLIGLAEELNELDYQLKHREISRPDYDRSKQRLTILRRHIQKLAAENREDMVPELLVLADDELANLGLSAKPDPDQLQTGGLLDNQWKLLGIERGRMRFFVFKQLPQVERDVIADRLPHRKFDPQEVIETIVVRENPLPLPPSQDTSKTDTRDADKPAGSTPDEMARASEPQPRFYPPRLLHIYVPQYTDKAREKGVEGELVVRALFQNDGKIKNVKVEKGLGSGLDQRAIESVKKIAFFPAQFDGKDVNANVRLTFNFKLGKVTFYLKTAESSETAKGVGK